MIITNSRYALVGYFITSYPTRAHGITVIYFEIKWVVDFFTTSKCERPNHLLKAKSQSEFILSLIVSPSFRDQSAKKTCVRFAMFNFSEKLQNIFEIGLKIYGAIVQKSPSKKEYLEIKSSQTLFLFFIYLKLATVQI